MRPAGIALLAVIASILCAASPGAAQEPPSGQDDLTIEDISRELGPFQLGGQQFTAVLQEKHITGASVPDPDWQTTLFGIEFKDSKGTVHYRKSFPYEVSGAKFADVLSAAVELIQGKDRAGLLVTYGAIPSTPLGGQSWQIFGVFDDKLIPFSKPIYAEGELVNPAKDDVVQLAEEPLSDSEVLNFRVWTGNFFVIYPLRVDFVMANVMPAWRCAKMTAWGIQPRCHYAIEADRQPQEPELTFVRMHVEPEEDMGVAEHVVVKRDSQVEILAAEGEVEWLEDENGVGLAPDDDFWIKVRIDGKSGWIHTQEDFLALGLPQAG